MFYQSSPACSCMVRADFVIGFIIFYAITGHNYPSPIMMGMPPDQRVSEYYCKYPKIGLFNYSIIFGTWAFAFFGLYNYFMLKHVYKSSADQAFAVGRLTTA